MGWKPTDSDNQRKPLIIICKTHLKIRLNIMPLNNNQANINPQLQKKVLKKVQRSNLYGEVED